MKPSIRQNRYFRSICRKVVVASVLSCVASAVSISPALADQRAGYGPNQRYVDHGPRGWHGNRQSHAYGYGYQPPYRPVYRQPYTYAQPVYVPPPAYYPPRPSPGVTLFFPLQLRW